MGKGSGVPYRIKIPCGPSFKVLICARVTLADWYIDQTHTHLCLIAPWHNKSHSSVGIRPSQSPLIWFLPLEQCIETQLSLDSTVQLPRQCCCARKKEKKKKKKGRLWGAAAVPSGEVTASGLIKVIFRLAWGGMLARGLQTQRLQSNLRWI